MVAAASRPTCPAPGHSPRPRWPRPSVEGSAAERGGDTGADRRVRAELLDRRDAARVIAAPLRRDQWLRISTVPAGLLPDALTCVRMITCFRVPDRRVPEARSGIARPVELAL